MNEQQKLEGNIACAKLLEWKNYDVLNEGGCIILHHRQVKSGTEFDIFTNALQCLEVVKKLGTSNGVSIEGFKNGLWMWDSNEILYSGIEKTYNTYEEAVAAAAMEVMKGG